MGDGFLARTSKRLQGYVRRSPKKEPIPEGFVRLPHTGRIVPEAEVATDALADESLRRDKEEAEIQAGRRSKESKARSEAEERRKTNPYYRLESSDEPSAEVVRWQDRKARIAQREREGMVPEQTVGRSITDLGNTIYDKVTDFGVSIGMTPGEKKLGGHVAGVIGQAAQVPFNVIGGALQGLDPASSEEERWKGPTEALIEVFGGAVVGKAIKTGGTAVRRLVSEFGKRTGREISEELSESMVKHLLKEDTKAIPAHVETRAPRSIREVVEAIENPRPPVAEMLEPDVSFRPRTIKEVVEEIERSKPIEDVLTGFKPKEAVPPAKDVSETPSIARNTTHQDTDEVRQILDLPAREATPEKVSEWLIGAAKHEGKEATIAKSLVDDPRPISKTEGLALGRRLNILVREMEDAKATGNVDAYDLAKAEANQIADGLDAGGSEWGRSGRARQQLMAEDFSDFGIKRRAEKSAGRPLSQKQQAEFDDIAKRLAEAEARALAAESDTARVLLARDVKTRKAPAMKRDELNTELDDLFKEFATVNAKATSGIDPQALAVIGKIVVNRARYGVATAEELIATVRQAFKERGLSEPSDEDILKAYSEARPRRTQAEISAELKSQRAALVKLNREVDDIVSGKTAERAAKSEAQQSQKAKKAAEKRMTAEQRVAEVEARKLAAEEQGQLLGARKPADKAADRRKALEANIADLEKQLKTGEFAAPKAKRDTKTDRQTERLRFERDQLKRQIDQKIKALEPTFWNSPVGKTIKESAAIIRGLNLGSDIGVLLRQGAFGLVNHPVAYSKALVQGAKAARSDVNLALSLREIAERSINGVRMDAVRKKAGLQLTDALQSSEEGFQSKALKLVPGQQALERGQSALINNLRSSMFDDFYAANPNATAAQLKQRASLINSALGRSNLKSVSEGLNVAMTSARWTTSRWEMVGRIIKTPATALQAVRRNPAARQELKDLGRYAGALYGVYKTAEAAGAEIEFDPKSSDFLKIRVGDTVYDPTSGMAGPVRLALRLTLMATGQMEVTQRSNSAIEIGKQLSYTASPVVRQAMTQIPGAGLTGFEFEEHEKGWWSVAPLIVSGFAETLKKEGAGAAAARAATEAVGINSQRYPKRAPAATSKKRKSQLGL